MKKIFHFTTISLFSTVLIFSCVTKKKYDSLNLNKVKLEAEKADCEEKLKTTQAELDRLNNLTSELTKVNESLKSDSNLTHEKLDKLTQTCKQINDSYEKLLQSHNTLQSSSKNELSKLATDLAKREKELIESERKIGELTANLKAREERVKELEQVLSEKEQVVNELKTKVSKALLGFKEKDLTINVKNGKVYVSLSEQLLFKSGSTAVDSKGIEALKKLAEALKDQKDISVMVEGHTDDVPIAKGTLGVKDNWDLSVLRATEITRILTSSGLDPKLLIPAGRGEFHPIAEGKTSEARQKNRRTEIILSPKLDELFKILDAE